MPPVVQTRQQILAHARENELFRPRDLQSVANPRPQIRSLVDEGILLKVGHGLYTLADREPSGAFSLAQAAARIPDGVLCLISALDLHGLTTQMPYQVWLAIGDKRKLTVHDVPVRIIRMSGPSFTEGVETRLIGNIPVKAYSAAKTVADCFKFRDKVGLDVALEALRQGWGERKFKLDDLMKYARINRVEKVMRPYIEMLIS